MADFEMKKAPAYQQSLLEGESTEPHCRRQCKRQGKFGRCLAFVVGCALVAMAVMFVGGWYAGKHHEHHHSKSSDDLYDNADYYSMKQNDGSDYTVPVMMGSVPATDFVQCKSVGTSSCMSGNPLLTPKGTLQLTLYKYNGQTSILFTGTGENYGEEETLFARRKRATCPSVSSIFSIRNCSGRLFQPTTNDYEQYDHTTEIPKTGLDLPFSYNCLTSHTSIIALAPQSRAEAANFQHCQIFFQNLKNTVLTLRSMDDITTSDTNSLPTADNPLNIGPSVIPLEPGPVDLSQFKSPDSGASSPMFPDQSFDVSPIDLGFRRRRAVTGESSQQQGSMFKLYDRKSGNPLSTIRMYHDKRHGGKNGTMTYDVTNHQAQCRTRFTMLFHKMLSNGTKMENVSHHQTFMFRHQNAAGVRNFSMWQSVTPYDRPATSTSYPLVGQIPSEIPCFTRELNDLNDRFKLAGQAAQVNPLSTNSRPARGLSWNCGLWDSVKQGFECGHSAYDCGSDIAEGDVTFGLTLFKAADDCYHAGDDCYHLVNNCVGGL